MPLPHDSRMNKLKNRVLRTMYLVCISQKKNHFFSFIDLIYDAPLQAWQLSPTLGLKGSSAHLPPGHAFDVYRALGSGLPPKALTGVHRNLLARALARAFRDNGT